MSESFRKMLAPGVVVDHFEVLGLLGKGGIGEVYLAKDLRLERKIVLKIIHTDKEHSPEKLEGFLQEARAIATFNHPNIITIHDVGQFQGLPYLALEYLKGQDLRVHMREGRLERNESLRICLAVAEALAEAHKHGISHLDLKPENIFITEDKRIRVLDFGLAKGLEYKSHTGSSELQEVPSGEHQKTLPTEQIELALDEEEDAFDEDSWEEGDWGEDSWDDGAWDESDWDGGDFFSESSMHSAEGGALPGTPAYMAPEQWRATEVGTQADIWAFGVVLFELLCGVRPFRQLEASKFSLMAAIGGNEELTFEHSSELPSHISEIIERCLLKDPEERPEAAELVQKLKKQVLLFVDRIPDEIQPFRGLLPFNEHHAHFFFGRDAERSFFLERFEKETILPVVGASGAGKSSFVYAGVLPHIKEKGPCSIFVIRPGYRPFEALAARLLSENERDEHTGRPTFHEKTTSPQLRSGEALSSSNARYSEDELTTLARELFEHPERLVDAFLRKAKKQKRRIILFIDQLEELYTLVKDKQVQRHFLEALCAGTEHQQDAFRIIFTIRHDFLDRLQGSERVRKALFRVLVLWPPGKEAIFDILHRPLEMLGYTYDDPEMIKEIQAAVEGESASLPLLQFTLHMLWERRDKEERCLRRAAYDQIGGVAGALATHAEQILKSLPSAQIQIAKMLLLQLVTPQKTRKVMTKKVLLQRSGKDSAEVLSHLIEARLLSVRKNKQDATRVEIELAHESLIHSWEQLAVWLEESREERVFFQELEQVVLLWEKRGRRADEVWQGDALREAIHKTERFPSLELTPDILAFLELGKAREQQKKVRRRGAIFLSFLLLAGITLLSLWFAHSISEQKKQVVKQHHIAEKKHAEAQRLSAQKAFSRKKYYDTRIFLRNSLEIEDSPLSRLLWAKVRHKRRFWTKKFNIIVYELAFSPDGSKLAVVSQDQSVYIIDTLKQEVQLLRGHRDQVLSVHFSPDGRLLATGDWTGRVHLWNRGTGRYRLLKAHSKGINSVRFSPKGDLLVTSAMEKKICVWRVPSGKLVKCFVAHNRAIRRLEFHPKRPFLISAGMDAKIHLWSIPDFRKLKTLDVGTSRWTAIRFSRDGVWFAGAERKGVLWLWKVPPKDIKGEWKATLLSSSKNPIATLDFSPDNKELAVSFFNSSIQFWRLSDLKRMKVIPTGWGTRSIRYSPDGTFLASGGSLQLQLWDLRTKKIKFQKRVKGHGKSIYFLSFSHDSKNLVSFGWQGHTYQWNVEKGSTLRLPFHNRILMRTIRFHPKKPLLIYALISGILYVLDTHKREIVNSFYVHQNTNGRVTFAPDGEHIAVMEKGTDVLIKNIYTTKIKVRCKGFRGMFTDTSFHPKGEAFVMAGDNGKVYLWNLEKEGRLHRLVGHIGMVKGAQFHPDGERLLTAGYDKTIRIWDWKTRKHRIFGREKSRILHLSIHPSGKFLAVALSDNTVNIWSIQGKKIRTLRGHRGHVNYLHYSPNGKYLGTASDDRTIRMWDAYTGRPYWRAPLFLQDSLELFTHRGWADCRYDPPKELGKTHLPTSQPSSKQSVHGKKWRRFVAQYALRVASRVGSEHLCIRTFSDSLSVWSMKKDRPLLSRSFTQLKQVLNLPNGCAVLSQKTIYFVDLHNNLKVLPLQKVKSIGVHNQGFWASAADSIYLLDERGNIKKTFPGSFGVTHVLLLKNNILAGFFDGTIEFVQSKGQKKLSGFSFEGTSSSAVRKMLKGPMDTIIVGYANGAYGIWSLKNGRRLLSGRLHGAIEHMFLRKGFLYIATELGAYHRQDLSIFRQSYCSLLREVWKRVPTVWSKGVVVVKAPPEGHFCVK